MSNNKFSKYYPSLKNEFEPYQKQRGYLVSSQFGGPLDSAEILLTLPSKNMFNLYPGKMAYIMDRDEYWFYNNESTWQRITESGIDNDTQAFFDIDFDVSVKASGSSDFLHIDNNDGNERYDSSCMTFIFKDGDEIRIKPSIVINFKGYAIDVSVSGDFTLAENGIPQNTVNTKHTLTKNDSSFDFTVSADSSWIKSGNLIYSAVFDNGTVTTEDDITIRGKLKYAVDPKDNPDYDYKTVFSDIKNNIFFLHPQTSLLQKGFIVSSQSGGALDVGSYVEDASTLSTADTNFYIGKKIYAYSEDNWYYFSYNGDSDNYEINFPDFSLPIDRSSRIKSFMENNDFVSSIPGKYELFTTNENAVGTLSDFKINITAEDPILSKNLSGNQWVLSYDGWWDRSTAENAYGQSYNTVNASGIIQPTGPDETLGGSNSSKVIPDGGYQGLGKNLLDTPKTLMANLQAILQIGTTLYEIPVNVPSDLWTWTVNGVKYVNPSDTINIDVSNYTFNNNPGNISVSLDTDTLPYFTDASTQNISYTLNSYYRKSEIHVSKTLQGLLSDWIDSTIIPLSKGRYDTDTTQIYVNLVGVNKSYARNDVDDTYYLLKSDSQNETAFSVKGKYGEDTSTEFLPASSTYDDQIPLYGQYHTIDISTGADTISTYTIDISAAFSEIAGSSTNPYARDERTYTVLLSDYVPNYSIDAYTDAALTEQTNYINFDILTYQTATYMYVSLLDDNDFLKGTSESRDSSITWNVSAAVFLNPNSGKDASAEGYLTDASVFEFLSYGIDESVTLSKGVSKALKIGFNTTQYPDIYDIFKSGTADSVVYLITIEASDGQMSAADSSTAEMQIQVHLESSKYQIQYRFEDATAGKSSIWYNSTEFSNAIKGLKQYPLADSSLSVSILNETGSYTQNDFLVRSRIVTADSNLDSNSRIQVADGSVDSFIVKAYDDSNNLVISTDSSSMPSVLLSRSYFNKTDKARKYKLDVSAMLNDGTIYQLKGNTYIGFNAYMPIITAKYTGFTSFLPSEAFIDAKSGTLKAYMTDKNDGNLLDGEFSDGYKISYAWAITENDDNLLSIATTDGSTCTIDVSPNLTTDEKNIEITCTAVTKRFQSSTITYTSVLAIDYTFSKNETVSGISSTVTENIFTNGQSLVSIPVTVSGTNLSGDNIFSSTGDLSLVSSQTTVGADKSTATYYFTGSPSVSRNEIIAVNGVFTKDTSISKNFDIFVLGFQSNYTTDSSYLSRDATPVARHILGDSSNSVTLTLNAVTDASSPSVGGIDFTQNVSSVNKPYSVPSVLTEGSSYYTGSIGNAYGIDKLSGNQIRINGISSNAYDSSFMFVASLNLNGMATSSNMISFTTGTINFTKPAVSIISPASSTLYTDASYYFIGKVTETTSAGTTDITSEIDASSFRWSLPQIGNISGNNISESYITPFTNPTDITLLATVYKKNPALSGSSDYILSDKISGSTVQSIIKNISITNGILSNYGIQGILDVSRNDIEYISDYINLIVNVTLNLSPIYINNINSMITIGVENSISSFTPNSRNWIGNSDSSYMELYTSANSSDDRIFTYNILIRPNYSRYITADGSLNYTINCFESKYNGNIKTDIKLKEITSTTQQLSIPYSTDSSFVNRIVINGRNLSVSELWNDISYSYGSGSSLPLQTIGGILSSQINSIIANPVTSNSFIVTLKFMKNSENSQNYIDNISSMSEINRYEGSFGITTNIFSMDKSIQSTNTSYSNFEIKMNTTNITTWAPYQLGFYRNERE